MPTKIPLQPLVNYYFVPQILGDMWPTCKGALSVAVLAATLQTVAGLAEIRVTASNNVVGDTADTYGINTGHAFSKSNWQMWLDRLGVRCSDYQC